MGCGRTDEGMFRCSTCLRSWYCDRDCQRKNWESHREQCHEVVIKTIQVAKSIKMKSVAKCRGSWVVGRGRGSWVWVVGVGVGKCRG